MKVKNIYAALGIILASGSLVFALAEHFPEAETQQVISGRIINAHARLFDRPDLSVPQVLTWAQEERIVSAWIIALDDLKRYVKFNFGGNKKLISAAVLVQEKGTKLPLMIKYDFKKPGFFSDLSRIKIELQEKAKLLEKTTFFIDRKKKNDAKELLLGMIFLLENTIDRMMNDFKNRKQ